MESQKSESKSIQVKIIPDPEMSLNYPRLYANYAAIQSSPFDFTIRFCDALPIFNPPNKGTGILENKIPIVAEIVLPVNIVPSLINAMQVHYDQYIKARGVPQKDEKKK
jgi:hypothetical protein